MTDQTLTDLMNSMAAKARRGADTLRLAGPEARTLAIVEAAKAIRALEAEILAANARDQQTARDKGLSEPMIERLILNPARIEDMAKGLEAVAMIDDPVGIELARWTRPNGLDIARVSTPIGVIAIIYESRPNVTADAAALCIRSSNAAILRTGSEAIESATAIYAAIQVGLRAAGLPDTAIQLVPTTDREAVGLILSGLNGAIHMIVPRGGKSLVERVQRDARAPVLAHLEGVNHTYVHADADPNKALEIVLNAKMRRTSVCGATETLLIDEAIAHSLLPMIAKALEDKGCELRGDDMARMVYEMAPAVEADWATEYSAATLSIKVVADFDHAVSHIKHYGTEHTEAIVTENVAVAEAFLNEVDAAIVMVNASTQFADGGEFGLGAEIGIATGRLHARGPVGAQQLTTFKYVVRGNGQIRA